MLEYCVGGGHFEGVGRPSLPRFIVHQCVFTSTFLAGPGMGPRYPKVGIDL